MCLLIYIYITSTSTYASVYVRACGTPCHLPPPPTPVIVEPHRPGFGALDSGSTLLVLPAPLYLSLTTHFFRAPAKCFHGRNHPLHVRHRNSGPSRQFWTDPLIILYNFKLRSYGRSKIIIKY